MKENTTTVEPTKPTNGLMDVIVGIGSVLFFLQDIIVDIVAITKNNFFINLNLMFNDSVKMAICQVVTYPLKTGYFPQKKKSWKKGRTEGTLNCLFVSLV